jgi:hypothetical protein
MTTLTGNDTQREGEVQRLLLDRLEARFKSRLAAEIERASVEMARQYEISRSDPSLPPDHQRAIERILLDAYAATVDVFGGRILDTAKARSNVMETKSFAEFFQRLALEYIGNEITRRLISGIAETTRNIVVNQIQQGQRNGDSIAEIAARIRETSPRFSSLRANIIARTETHGAANFAADRSARATGLKLRKEWISADDHRTRDFGEGDGVVDEYNHREMNGQTVEMDAPFKMPHKNGQELDIMFPGEAGAPAAAVINCRCSMAHIVDD